LRADVKFPDYSELVTDVVSEINHFIGYHRRRIIINVEQADELSNALAAADALRNFIKGSLYPAKDGILNQELTKLRSRRFYEIFVRGHLSAWEVA
jgi:hypothetical protein